MTNKQRIEDLERRIQELEDKVRKQIPRNWDDFPINNKPWPKPDDFPDHEPNKWPHDKNPWVVEKTRCPSCGIIFEGVMGFVCSNNRCPMGAGPIMC
jgi:hypothetical protein